MKKVRLNVFRYPGDNHKLFTRGRDKPLTYHECLNEVVIPHKAFFPDDTCRIIKDSMGGFMVRIVCHYKNIY